MNTTRFSIPGFVLMLTAGLALTGCETVRGAQSDLNRHYASLKSAIQSDPAPTDTTTSLAAAAPDSTCPDVRIVQDLNQVHQFANPASATPEQSVSSVRMLGVQDKCEIVGNAMAVDMTLAFAGSAGPKARAHAGDSPSFAYPYFVAITNNQGSIIAKDVFAVTMAYDDGKTATTRSEQIRQLIPLDDSNRRNYKVLIGFQLNEEELAYNRALPQETVIAQPANPVTLIEPAAGTPLESPVAN